MSKRVCLEPDCGTLIPAGTRDTRCDTHRRTRDKQRGTRQQRGYDNTYEQALRDPTYTNATHCTNCGEPFTPDNPKTGGHTTPLRHGGKGSPIEPHCRSCNYGWRRTGL